MKTLTEPTFDSIASSAKFIASPRKTNYKPLPCEKNAEIEGDSGITQLIEKFPVLDMSFIKQTYFDLELKTDMPLFAAVDVKTGKVDSGDRMFVRGLTVDSKLNPKLENIVTEIRAKWPFFVIGSVAIGGALFCGGISLNRDLGLPVSFLGSFIGFLTGGFASFVILSAPITYTNPSLLDKKKTIRSFSYQFDGQIPDDVRAIYHKEKSNFDSIHLICDAKNRWVSETRPLPPPNPDPLLVGVKRLKSGKDLVFLLAKFDLTPAEQYVADEFAI
jgi:hypothetical protein